MSFSQIFSQGKEEFDHQKIITVLIEILIMSKVINVLERVKSNFTNITMQSSVRFRYYDFNNI